MSAGAIGWHILRQAASALIDCAAVGTERPGQSARGHATRYDWRDRAPVVAAVVLALPLFVAALLELSIERPPLTGDVAATELSIMNATAFEQLIGSYSRLGFNHPGPLQFYLLAPLYWISGESSTAPFVMTAVCNAAALGCIVGVWFSEHRGAAERMLLLALLSLFLASFGAIELKYWELLTPLSAVWNPISVVLPFGALTLLCCAAANGRSAALPLATAVHAFVVQTHVVTGLAATVLLASAFVLSVRSPSADRKRSRVRALALSGAVALVLWAPPLVDQLAGRGNLATVGRFLVAPASVSAWGAIVHSALHLAFWSLPLRIEEPSGALQVAAIAITVLELGLLVVAYRIARSRAQGFAAASSLLGVLLILSAWLTARRLDDPHFLYLTSWLPLVAALNLSTAGAVVLVPRIAPRHREWLVLAAGGVVLLATIFSVLGLMKRAASRASVTDKSQAVQVMLPEIERQLGVEPQVALRAGKGGEGVLPGLALALVKRGVRPAIANDWCPDLGERVHCVSPTRPELVVTDSDQTCSHAIAGHGSFRLCREGAAPLRHVGGAN